MKSENNPWPTVEIVTEFMWIEILSDLDTGAVARAECFADLHDYTDANLYGLCAFPSAPPEEDEAAWDEWFDKVSTTMEPARNIVSNRLEKRSRVIG